jgi:hypothetical protein
MNRKAYTGILALVVLTIAFLSGCSSNGSFGRRSGNTYVFYLSGQELLQEGPNFYAIAGAVTIDSNGDVTGGEQDYNDGLAITATDTISRGSAALTVDPTTGQGTLTLTTSDTNIGVGGVETLGVQFVNTNHALIIQYDGSATSSGSLDLQTAATVTSANFAFTMSGVDHDYQPIGIGGVIALGDSVVNGTYDVNDDGEVLTGQTLTTGSVSSTDSFGRGTVTGTQLAGTLAYYVVGTEVIRFNGMDSDAAGVGSAFGQGTGTFTNASLGSSVFALAENPWSAGAAMAGQFAVSNTGTDPANFTGVGEDNELGNEVWSDLAASFAGTYSLQESEINGYGNMVVNEGFGNVANIGIYMTDPILNLNDPNNASGAGGALVLELDDSLPGETGVLISQTDTATADFAGNYAVGFQDFNIFSDACDFCEFDMVAQGPVIANGAMTFTGLVSDPFLTLGIEGGSGLYSGATFGQTPIADESNPGRYFMLAENDNPLEATIGSGSGFFDVTMYQASAGQLFWLNVVDTGEELGEIPDDTVFLGPLEQQGSLTGLPAATKAAAKSAQQKQK